MTVHKSPKIKFGFACISFQMHSGSPLIPSVKSPGLVTSIGIASLILEGRSHSDDDSDSSTSDDQPLRLQSTEAFSGPSTSHHHNSQTNVSFVTHQVPCGLDVANPSQSSNSFKGALYQSSQLQPSCSRPTTSSVPNDDDTVQRLRQKLMLIRSSPGTSRDAIQQSIAVPSGSTFRYATSIDSDDDLDMVFPSPTPSVAVQHRETGFINSLMTLATNTCLNTTPRSFGRMPDLMSIVDAWTATGYVSQNADIPFASSTPTQSDTPRASCFDTPKSSHCKRSSNKNNTTNNNMGPHCEEFMKKIGLIKSAKDAASSTSSANTTPIRTKSSPAVAYVEEHICVITSKKVSLSTILIQIYE